MSLVFEEATWYAATFEVGSSSHQPATELGDEAAKDLTPDQRVEAIVAVFHRLQDEPLTKEQSGPALNWLLAHSDDVRDTKVRLLRDSLFKFKKKYFYKVFLFQKISGLVKPYKLEPLSGG